MPGCQAGDLPAPVLSSVLGLHPNTAVRWSGFAMTSWADYIAARAHGMRRYPGKDVQDGVARPLSSRNTQDNCH
ncbi:hypothetical protein ABZ214_23375 [Streptomyces iakyrus]|uniref:hypothetical protein n=1 Tax=Streptomyces iakyrus TaxID=68219 RepID=UPI0033BE2830